MTNYERLMKHMNPESMAWILSQVIFINSCSICAHDANNCDCRCEKNILSWLQDPEDEKVIKLINALDIAEDIL